MMAEWEQSMAHCTCVWGHDYDHMEWRVTPDPGCYVHRKDDGSE